MWANFSAFVADMGERPKGTSIDRIDVNGPYCAENCRWSDARTQRANQRPKPKVNAPPPRRAPRDHWTPYADD
jgi:hypothetical protein